MVSYIRLGKYQNALDILHKNFSDFDKLKSEEAYCLYRLNKFDELLNLLRKNKSGNNSELNLRHLEAQMVCFFLFIGKIVKFEKFFLCTIKLGN